MSCLTEGVGRGKCCVLCAFRSLDGKAHGLDNGSCWESQGNCREKGRGRPEAAVSMGCWGVVCF